jgi:hypothetical protein
LGPYDEHLVRDVGALNLALCALLVFAAVVLEKRLVQAALVAWLVYAIPHFAFHLTSYRWFFSCSRGAISERQKTAGRAGKLSGG